MYKRYALYSADFETTIASHLKENGGLDNELRVWATAVASISNKPKIVHISNDINKFFSFVFTLENKVIFFHNLKFDGQFIFYYLLTHNFKCVWNAKYRLKNHEFKTIIDEQKNIYQIRVKFNGFEVVFMDSYKLIPSSVEQIAKDFETKVVKTKCDFEKYRRVGYKLSPEEVEYVSNDVLIMADALNYMKEQDMLGMTIGSVALRTLKNMIDWEKYFTKLNDKIDRFARLSYRGGYCYVAPDKKGKELGKNSSYDVNSMYPFQMKTQLIPYGEPAHGYGKYEYDSEYPLYIQSIITTFRLKKGYVPTVMVKNRLFAQIDYMSEGTSEKLTLTSVDLELFKKHYDIIDIQYIEYYKFKASSDIFKEYIDKYYKQKQNSTGAKKTVAKLMLNAITGKFASRPERENYEPYLLNGVVEYRLHDTNDADTVYTPVTSFITGYSRKYLINIIQQNFDRFIYCDTDSIKLMGWEVPRGTQLDNDKLGYFADETPFVNGKLNRAINIKVLRQKRYLVEYENGDRDIKCCGLPQDIANTLKMSDFYEGNIIQGKKRSKRMAGGVAIINTTFELK